MFSKSFAVLSFAFLLVLFGATDGLAQYGADSEADCRKSDYTFTPDGETNVDLKIRKGATCTFRFRTRNGIFFGIAVVERPKLGVIAQASQTLFLYRSNGRVGSDRFIVDVRWQTRGYDTRTTMKVNVQILDKLD